MKTLHYLLGMIASIAIIVVLAVTSFEIATYSDFGWYEKEYEKYGVLADLEMEMTDVMDVTEEMMEYLHGDREDLVVNTVVAGEEREFFNDREKAHMVDVLHLFLGGFRMRSIAAVVAVLALAVVVLTKGNLKSILPKAFLFGTGLVTVITGAVGALFVTDFNKYFIMFHHMFFDNDLWLLDPDTDLMIRMLPEGFFLDMVIRIGTIFLIALGVFLFISVLGVAKQRNKKNL